MSDKVNPNADRILQVLNCHHGRERAITSLSICAVLDWPVSREREVRAIIEQYANGPWEGTLCGIPGSGYFFAKDIEEIATYRRFLLSLRDRARDKLVRFDLAAKREGFDLKEVAA
jgi:hypothetical protein